MIAILVIAVKVYLLTTLGAGALLAILVLRDWIFGR